MESNIQDASTTMSSSLCRVTPVSKYLAMILFIILPFVGGWIGYIFVVQNSVPPMDPDTQIIQMSDFKDDSEGLPQDQVGLKEEVDMVSEGSSADQDKTQLLSCNDTGVSKGVPKTSETSLDWLESLSPNGLFFKVPAPAGVSITRQDESNSFVLEDATTGLNATVRVWKLEQEIFRFKGSDYSQVAYELNSNTFWKYVSNTPPVECDLDESNYTKNQNIVLVTWGGDVGASWTTYNIILKPTPGEYEEYDGNRSVAVTITYGGDANDPSYNREAHEIFAHMIEIMVQNMELLPIAKG